MLERCCRQRWHDGRDAGAEHPLGHELLGLAAEEALAERQIALHQVHHGTRTAPLLI